MKPVVLFRLLFVIASLALGAVVVHAENLGAVKARMEQRQSSVDALKERGVVGEDNRGYLEARGSLSAGEQQIVTQENADRKTVYAAIAAESGTSAADVGRRRAAQIAQISKPGVWIQAPNGQWSKK